MTSVIAEAFRGLTSDLDTATLSRALSSRSVGAAVQAFNWSTFGERMSTSRIPLLQQIVNTGVAETRSIGRVVGAYAFDVTDPRATAWAAARSGELVVGIGESVRAEIRQLITSSFVNQIDPRQIAREIPRQIGLFPRWAAAVENSYQRNVTSFLAEGLTSTAAEERAERLAEAYRDRLIDSRSMMIARTEVMTAANEGRAISWQQAQDAGLVDLSNSSKEWIAEGDACEECSIYDGEIVAADGDFSSDDGMPPAHPNCRCTAVLIPDVAPGDAESSKPSDDEIEIEE
jgi:SPP1 gp7 family putative phage head morphogenesis protein